MNVTANGVPTLQRLVNQTYFTVALYWINHGFTDVQRAEFEVITNIQAGLRLSSPQNSEGQQLLESSMIFEDKTNLKDLSKSRPRGFLTFDSS